MSGVQTVTYEFRSPATKPSPVGRVPRVARLLVLAHRLDGGIRCGEIRNWAEAARLVGVTRARMTQIARLLLLSPPIQEAILSLPLVAEGDDPITERDLRRAVSRADWREQEWPLLRLGLKPPAPSGDRLPAPASSACHCAGAPLAP